METEQTTRPAEAYKTTVTKSKGEGLVRPRKQKRPARLKRTEDGTSVANPTGKDVAIGHSKASSGASVNPHVPKLTYGKHVQEHSFLHVFFFLLFRFFF